MAMIDSEVRAEKANTKPNLRGSLITGPPQLYVSLKNASKIRFMMMIILKSKIETGIRLLSMVIYTATRVVWAAAAVVEMVEVDTVQWLQLNTGQGL
jgi:hypothetical protein